MPITPFPPFNNWVSRTLPQVYDDTLSHYELVTQVVAHLNHVIENTNEFTAEITQLRDEIVNYRELIEREILPQNLETILNQWNSSGKLSDVINSTLFNSKADKTELQASNSRVTSLETSMNTKANKTDVGERKTVTTTSGQWWSTSAQELEATLDSRKRQVRTTAKEFKERVVFIGSSTTRANHLSDKSQAYFNVIASRLGSEYEVFGHGVGAEDTQDIINRFYRDVAPLQPDFVIIQLTIGNEGIYSSGDKVGVLTKFKNNILKLVRMVEKIGAQAVVMGQGVTGSYTDQIYNMALAIDRDLASSGVFMFDIMGNLASGAGNAQSALMHDNLHYNSLGNYNIANGFNKDLLKRIGSQPRGNLGRNSGQISMTTPTSGEPIVVPLDRRLDNWTVYFRFRPKFPQPDTSAKSFLGLDNATRLFMNPSFINHLYFFQGASQRIDNVISPGEWQSIAVTYFDQNKFVRIFINGVQVFSSEGFTINLTKLILGGRDSAEPGGCAHNFDYSDLLVYSTRLRGSQIKLLDKREYRQSSMEVFCPFTDELTTRGVPLLNLAPTLITPHINGNEDGLRPLD